MGSRFRWDPGGVGFARVDVHLRRGGFRDSDENAPRDHRPVPSKPGAHETAVREAETFGVLGEHVDVSNPPVSRRA